MDVGSLNSYSSSVNGLRNLGLRVLIWRNQTWERDISEAEITVQIPLTKVAAGDSRVLC